MSHAHDIRKATVARMIDSNGDGRLQAAEFVAAGTGVLRRAGVSAALDGCPLAISLTQLDGSALRDRFERFRSKYADYFENGIDQPSDQDFAKMANVGPQSAANALRFPLSTSMLEADRHMVDAEFEILLDLERRQRAKRQISRL